MLEIPHFKSIESPDRELFILGIEENGHRKEHKNDFIENADQFEHENHFEVATTKIFTTHFPRYFLIASRLKQDNHWIGPEGGMAKSSVVPNFKASFLPGAVKERVWIGIQACSVNTNLASSHIFTMEPRGFRFHTFNKGRKGVTVTIPLPERAFNQNKLRLLCSITGKTKRKSNLTFRVVLSAFIFAAGTSKAEWKDVTDKVELVFGTSCVQFETAVTGRFWLLESQNTENTTSEFESMATKLYYETIQYDQ